MKDTETPTLDAATALRLLREVVGERPDYVYESPISDVGAKCVYVHKGQPSCLIGRVLYRAGYGIDMIAALDRFGTIDYAAPEAHLPVARDAVKILAAAQNEQDDRNPWRDALVVAEHKARELGVSA